MRKLLFLAVLLMPRLGIADNLGHVKDMYDTMNSAHNYRESRRQQLHSYAGDSNADFDAVISQIQMQRQLRQQREMVDEMKRMNNSERDWAQIREEHATNPSPATEDMNRKWLCRNYPQYCK